MHLAERTLLTYESIAAAYHERTRNEDGLLHLMDRFVDGLPAAPLVLDAGCGTGRDATYLRERDCRVVGLDFSGAQLTVAREEAPDVAPVRGDLRAVPLSDGSVDGIWSCAVLHHLPENDLSDALSELYRVLRPGGRLFFTTKRGDGEEITYAYDSEDGRYYLYHEPEPFAERLRATGFAIDELDGVEDWFHALARR